MRILSLLPSATEIVAELGLLDALVGRSEECDWPPEVRGLPVASACRVDMAGLTGREIDAAVRSAVADGASLYALDAELVERLEPDVILTQNLCRVCAVSSDEVCTVGADVVSLDPHTLAEVAESVRLLGRRLGAAARGEEVASTMEKNLDRVRQATADLPRRRIFVAEWLDPPFAAGHWLPELVDVAGAVDVLGRAGEPSRETTWAAVAAAQPELIVLAPCGWDHMRAAAEAAAIDLPAPAVPVDSNRFFSRPSPRLAEGAEILARILHPELVPRTAPLRSAFLLGASAPSRARASAAGSAE
jgi:iron complex transport system substrate-binding protein